ncbi:MAG: hypothetical protein KGL39_00405 [Patescibacteria group bacterium]|nr:hypothetical protein [Patescibacteria group bacterium]
MSMVRLSLVHRQELERLLRRHRGALQAKHIYEASRSKSSCFHDLVKWDEQDEKLAQEYRMERCREILAAWRLKCEEAYEIANRIELDEREQLEYRQRLIRMEELSARRTIVLDGEKNQRSVIPMVATVSGRRRILDQMFREFHSFIGRCAYIPEFHDRLLKIYEQEKVRFLPQQPLAEAGD